MTSLKLSAWKVTLCKMQKPITLKNMNWCAVVMDSVNWKFNQEIQFSLWYIWQYLMAKRVRERDFFPHFTGSKSSPKPFRQYYKISFLDKSHWRTKKLVNLYFFRVLHYVILNHSEEVEVFKNFGSSMIFVQKMNFLILSKKLRAGFWTYLILFSFEVMLH